MTKVESKLGVAITKYVRMSPKRARQEARKVVKVPATRAINSLSFVCSKTSTELMNTIRSAMANCEFKYGARQENMILHTLQIDEGPKLKRGRPRSKGRTSPILRPTVHIKAVIKVEDADRAI